MNATLCSVPTGEITDDSISDLAIKKKLKDKLLGCIPKLQLLHSIIGQ